MKSWTVTLLLLYVWGPIFYLGRGLPVRQQEENEDERSFKRELELFDNQVMDDWKLDDNEYLSRRELQEQKDALSKKHIEENENKRWLDVDQNKALSKKSPADDEELPKNGEIFEGDIVMSTFVREVFNGEAAKRDAVSLREYYWPHHIVHFEFDPKIDRISKRQIRRAIFDYHKYTCIKFLPKMKDDGVIDYIRFISNGSACYSNVGRRGGMQTVSIGTGCHRLGTPIHELMHVLGFFHEMTRPDRDDNVEIHWENIQHDLKHNFKLIPVSMDKPIVDYNIFSVMHYSNDAFTKNGQNTITYLENRNLHFGQREGFSVGDIIQINTLYKCTELNEMFKNLNLGHIMKDDTRLNNYFYE